MTAHQISPFPFSAFSDSQSAWPFSILKRDAGACALSPRPIAHSELFYYIFVSYFGKKAAVKSVFELSDLESITQVRFLNVIN